MPRINQNPGKTAPPSEAAPPSKAVLAEQPPLPTRVVGLSAIERGFLPATRSGAADSTLSVGQGIQVKGEIESCETLIVDGRVEASLTAELLKVRKGGLFEGTATVARAEIAGTFTGQLKVREHLTIHGTGQVSGTIRYHRIAVEDGGQISGDVGVESGGVESGGIETGSIESAPKAGAPVRAKDNVA